MQTLARLKGYVVKFDDPATPYRSIPRPALFHRFQEYGHLARIGEWLAEDDA
jgi:ATP-dependent helicase/nuclease subunit B